MLNSTILATQSRLVFISKKTRFRAVKEFLFALFLFQQKINIGNSMYLHFVL